MGLTTLYIMVSNTESNPFQFTISMISNQFLNLKWNKPKKTKMHDKQLCWNQSELSKRKEINIWLKGKENKNSWETKANLACWQLMSDFDDREDDHDDDDIEYTIKKIIGKRKNGRTYEYQVVWSGCDEDTATWEPEDNLQNAKGMISNFERAQKKEFEG